MLQILFISSTGKSMYKNYNNWCQKKWDIENSKQKKIFVKEKEIWFASLWQNIWDEQDGKWDDFLRPIIILKKFNNNLFLGIPLTSKNKTWYYYKEIINNKWKESTAILSQIRILDTKRLKYRQWYISLDLFVEIKNRIKEIL